VKTVSEKLNRIIVVNPKNSYPNLLILAKYHNIGPLQNVIT